MSLRQKLHLADGTALFGLVLALVGAYADLGAAVCLPGCGLLLAGSFLTFRWKRCPACKKWLGRNNPDFCPWCGRKIDYDAKPARK